MDAFKSRKTALVTRALKSPEMAFVTGAFTKVHDLCRETCRCQSGGSWSDPVWGWAEAEAAGGPRHGEPDPSAASIMAPAEVECWQ